MKRTVVLLGNYGSGKSELALNMAIKGKNSVMVDLDIINPYFRSSDMEQMLNEYGIDVIKPVYAGTGVEGLSLPPTVYSVFIDHHENVIFDVGGDSTGSVALGQYRLNFKEAENLEVLFVINTCRPLSSTTNSIVELIEQVQAASRLKITGLVNNTNLSNDTTGEILASGYEVVSQVSSKMGIPVKYTSGTSQVLREFTDYGICHGFNAKYIGEYIVLERYMKRDWERFVENAGFYNN